MDKVSVIIPTYNRFKFLLNTIRSVKEQTYTNIEIIVINDCSDEKEYYEYDWNSNGVNIIHLPENSRKIFGFPCHAYVRNTGIEKASGKYVAFCDDDDMWFPNKITLQLEAMKRTGCKMSSTDGLIGFGVYDPNKKYKKFITEYSYESIKKIFVRKRSNLLDNGYPEIWNLEFLKVHNCIICSSLIIEKEILTKINNMRYMKNAEDYDCWLRALEHTNNVYVNEICIYYDDNHGYGRNY